MAAEPDFLAWKALRTRRVYLLVLLGPDHGSIIATDSRHVLARALYGGGSQLSGVRVLVQRTYSALRMPLHSALAPSRTGRLTLAR